MKPNSECLIVIFMICQMAVRLKIRGTSLVRILIFLGEDLSFSI